MAGGPRNDVAPASARERLAAAALELVLDRGYGGVEIAELLQRAGISRAAFDGEFSGLEDCLLATVDEGVERFKRAVFSAYESGSSWREGLRAAAYAAARWVRENPRYILFATTMLNGASELARAHRDRALRMFVELVDAGRAEMDEPSAVSSDTAMAVIGSIYELLQREVSRGRGTARAEDFVPELMYLAVRPYLGHAEALKELAIPPPESTA